MNPVSESTEPRIGSILFTDLVGFTEYTDAVGDVAALDVLDQTSEMADKVLAEHHGSRVVKELGDGMMIWFDTATDGLEGATELLAAIDEARSTDGFPLAVRMGLHHGSAIPRGDDLIGQAVNIAARVSALAGPGELLVSDDVVTECGDSAPLAALQPLGPVTVKGVQEPIWLRRLDCRSKSWKERSGREDSPPTSELPPGP